MRTGIVAFILALCLTFLPCVTAQQEWYQSLSPCALECANSTLKTTSCSSLSDTCICSDKRFWPGMNECLGKSCMPKEIFSAMNITSVACGAPIRDKAPMYRATIMTLFGLTMVAAIARFASRLAYSKMSWLQDGCMAVVVVLDIAFIVAAFKQSLNGLGKDIWKVPYDQITALGLWDWITELLYCPVIGLTRVYFLLFFLSVFPERKFKIVAWSLVVFNLVYTTAYILPAIFTCTPINVLWLGWDGEHPGKCQDSMPRALSHGAISITCDLIILALPIRPIMNLQMERKKKIGILLIFCVGALVTIISIVRLKFLLGFRTTTNATYDLLPPALWSIIECQVAIICACMPTMRMLFVRLTSPPIRTTTSDSTPSYIKKSFGIGRVIEVKTGSYARSHLDTGDDFLQLVEVKANATPNTSKEVLTA